MLIVTTDHITGKNVEMLGLVKGSTIQTVHMGKDIMNGFKTLVGGELTSYNEMMNEARAWQPNAWRRKPSPWEQMPLYAYATHLPLLPRPQLRSWLTAPQ